MTELYSFVTTLAGIAIALWAFWRLNATPAKGDWLIKLPVLAIFAFGSMWELDRANGNEWSWDGAAFMLSIAVYLWAGSLRVHRMAQAARKTERNLADALARNTIRR